jgi:hypothetical protein
MHGRVVGGGGNKDKLAQRPWWDGNKPDSPRQPWQSGGNEARATGGEPGAWRAPPRLRVPPGRQATTGAPRRLLAPFHREAAAEAAAANT